MTGSGMTVCSSASSGSACGGTALYEYKYIPDGNKKMSVCVEENTERDNRLEVIRVYGYGINLI